MKVISVNKLDYFLIITDEKYNNTYRRSEYGNWEVAIKGSWASVSSREKEVMLEEAYQEYTSE